MKIFTATINFTIDKTLLPAPSKEVLFIDIETTGLSPAHSFVYLIGCIYFKNNTWNIKQFFLENIDSEKELINQFFDFIKPYSYLIQYNGEMFDIPFLEKRCLNLDINPIFNQFRLLDLYKEIRPYKNCLGLQNLKQANAEHFLNITRTDFNRGKDLIQIYQHYQEQDQKDSTLRSQLLLHNSNDLTGMLSILSMRAYSLFFQGSFSLTRLSMKNYVTNEQTKQHILHMILETPHEFPKPLTIKLSIPNLSTMSLLLTSKKAELFVPTYYGWLKYFYPNYKDYYYLPETDSCIHKNALSAIEKTTREKAKASNCYMKKQDIFLPYPLLYNKENFFESYQSNPAYFKADNHLWDNKEFLYEYPKHLLNILVNSDQLR